MTLSTSPSWRLDLTLLGIGGAFDADRGIANTGALVTLSEGDAAFFRILLDCGHTCGHQLHALGLTYQDIDAVLITHAHGDHIDGLETLGYKSRFLYQRTRPLYARQDVLDATWSALAPKMGRLQIARDQSIAADLGFYFDPRAVGDEPVPLAEGRIAARFVPVHHVQGMPAYGILLDLDPGSARGPVLRWSGDCTFDPEGPLFAHLDAERGDRVFHDCIFYPYYEATVHTHFESLAILDAPTREAVVLVHHGLVEENPAPRGGMILGQPLQRFSFTPAPSSPST